MLRRRGTVLNVVVWLLLAAGLTYQFAEWSQPSQTGVAIIRPSDRSGAVEPTRPVQTPRTTVTAPTAPSLTGRASVIDGDTLEIRGQRIRLWGIDAPEGRQLCRIEGKPWRCGQQAALALSDWIGQRTVTCNERDRDRYGRIVATCSVGGHDMGAWLVRTGWALDWPQYSRGAFAAEQAEAIRARRGMWQGEFEKPWEWRRQ
jgi:endonuclease YncB( thermonuclease family)